jgi:hypothetical protein
LKDHVGPSKSGRVHLEKINNSKSQRTGESTNAGHILRNPLNTNLNINNEKTYCNIDTVCIAVLVRGGECMKEINMMVYG